MFRWKAVELEAVGGDFEGAMRDVHVSDARELALAEQQSEQLAFATAEIEHARSTAGFERGEDGSETLIMQAERCFERFLLDDCDLGGGFERGIIGQLRERVIDETAPVFEVAARDGFALGMRSEPAFAVAHELLHFVAADPVMFIAIKHGDEHVEMAEQRVQRQRGAKFHAMVAALFRTSPMGSTTSCSAQVQRSSVASG